MPRVIERLPTVQYLWGGARGLNHTDPPTSAQCRCPPAPNRYPSVTRRQYGVRGYPRLVRGTARHTRLQRRAEDHPWPAPGAVSNRGLAQPRHGPRSPDPDGIDPDRVDPHGSFPVAAPARRSDDNGGRRRNGRRLVEDQRSFARLRCARAARILLRQHSVPRSTREAA